MGENIYSQYRKRAAVWDNRLNSRDGAAALLGVSESSLANYELGVTKNIPVDMIVMMAERYHAPELKYHYCKNECPIGRNFPVASEDKPIEQATIHLLDSLSEEKINEIKRRLIQIAADGRVSDAEIDDLTDIVQKLESVSESISELRIIVEKHTKMED